MNEETKESLNKIRKLICVQEQPKRYMKAQTVCKNYQLDRNMLIKEAKKCGAIYKIRNITLIEMNTFNNYYKKNITD